MSRLPIHAWEIACPQSRSQSRWSGGELLEWWGIACPQLLQLLLHPVSAFFASHPPKLDLSSADCVHRVIDVGDHMEASEKIACPRYRRYRRPPHRPPSGTDS
jgi:hypothetical protein